MSLSKSDFQDTDLVDSTELASDGYSSYKTISVTSTTSGSKTVEVSPSSDIFGLLFDADAPVSVGDRVLLVGTTGGADGYYTVASVIDNDTFTVLESINTSTGGNAFFIYPPGASLVGFDPTGLSITTAKNVQDALKDVAQNASGITANAHQTLRQLIHFIDDGPADGFVSGAYKEILPSGQPFPTSIIWWESAAKTEKIVEKTYTYNPNKTVSQVEWKMYDTDGSTVLIIVTDSISYVNGIFELSRVRSIGLVTNPVINSLSTNSVTQFEPEVNLTVTGTGFTIDTVVWVDGVARITSFINSGSISCILPAAGLADSIHELAGTYSVQAKDPNMGDSNTVNYTVTAFPNVYVWHRADQEITYDGSNRVSDWGDIGPTADTNKDLQQTVVNRQPTYNASDANYNNKPTVTFANGKGMPCKGTWASNLSPPWTLFVVGGSDSAVWPAYAFSSITSGANGGPKYALYGWSGIVWASFTDEATGGLAERLSTNDPSNAPSIVCAVGDGSNSAVYVNHHTNADATGTFGTLDWQDHCVGAYLGQASNSFRGPIAESILIAGNLSQSNRQNIMTYLSNRYGLAISA